MLLSAPRRSAAEPNHAGTHALYTVSTYSFESHRKTTEIRLLDMKTKKSTLITNEEGVSEAHWLEDEILYLKSGPRKETALIVSSISDVTKNYTAAVVPGPISEVKLKTLEKGRVALVASGKAAKNGSLFNPELEQPKHHTGLLYDTLMVRHWDKYVKSEKNALFYGLFQLSAPHITETKGTYSLSPLQNALMGTHLESPIEPWGGGDHFDISAYGLIFVSTDPELDPAINTKCNAYFLPVDDYRKPANPSGPIKIQLGGFEGAATSPVFSPDGKSAAFLQMRENGYESDKYQLIIVSNMNIAFEAEVAMSSDDGKGLWDKRPGQILFSNDGKIIYLVAPDEGTESLFSIEFKTQPSEMKALPKKLTSSGAVSTMHRFGTSDKGVLFTHTSLIDNSVWSLYDPDSSPEFEKISSNTQDGKALGLSTSQTSSFWFVGARNRKVHALVMKPSDFDSEKKYPLAFLIHGGPQGAWDDAWSTRWNPAVYAEQGYVVVTPNPTGSTGYGQEFTDAIQNNWGSLPYEDLVASFEHIKNSPDLSFIDTSRAVALGASYGGYMMNWINGHSLGREFKALVCHDGVFSMQNQISSDEQYFPTHEMKGFFWSSPETMANWDRWDPARYAGNWSTPTLIIHNGKDYRLPISEGLAAFNALQLQGVDSQFLTFPDENHWVLDEENSLVWHTVVLNWINKYVGLPEYRKGEGPEPERVASWKRD